jgi:hypothetical protein
MKPRGWSGGRMREGGENGYGERGIKLGKPKNSRKIRSKPLSHASYFYTVPFSLLVVDGYRLDKCLIGFRIV